MKTTLRAQLENKGYKVSIVMSTGNYVAKKGSKTYVAESIEELHNIILGNNN